MVNNSTNINKTIFYLKSLNLKETRAYDVIHYNMLGRQRELWRLVSKLFWHAPRMLSTNSEKNNIKQLYFTHTVIGTFTHLVTVCCFMTSCKHFMLVYDIIKHFIFLYFFPVLFLTATFEISVSYFSSTLHYKTFHFPIRFSLSFHYSIYFLLYFPCLFTIQLRFLPYFSYIFTIQLAFLLYFPYLFTIQLTFLP
jgi:hypothetical protein